jgi:hypothetical protein
MTNTLAYYNIELLLKEIFYSARLHRLNGSNEPEHNVKKKNYFIQKKVNAVFNCKSLTIDHLIKGIALYS